MSNSANYGTYETTEDEIDTFLRHSIKPFMKRRLSEIDSLRAKNEHLEEQLRLVRSVAVDEVNALPRVITADECRAGMTVHARSEKTWSGMQKGQWYDGLIEDHSLDAYGLYFNSSMLSRFDVIVLLADAPDTKDINAAKETLKGEYPDNPWFSTVYEDATHWAQAWRGTPIRPQSIRAGDLYDIHTAHGSRITGVVAARNGVRNPQSGDQYRLVNRKA